jgi:hypothetical protein
VLDKLYITPRQWLQIARWSIYAALFLFAMMVQTVVLGNRLIFGVHPELIPVVITCVCLREGPERGGLFALLTSLIWCLSGADMGSVSIAVLTIVPVLGALACRTVLANRFAPTLLFCFLTLLGNQGVIFCILLLLGRLAATAFLAQVVPCVLVSVVTMPLFYWLVKTIARIGASYEST